MSAHFLHIGRFDVNSEKRSDFIAVMKDYEEHARQKGLDHSHLIEDEKAPNTFMHITVWASRDDWVAIEKSDVHQEMHAKRDKLLASPMEHDFVCGRVEM